MLKKDVALFCLIYLFESYVKCCSQIPPIIASHKNRFIFVFKIKTPKGLTTLVPFSLHVELSVVLRDINEQSSELQDLQDMLLMAYYAG